jgi:hypothetical protein
LGWFIYTWEGGWQQHRITKITRKRFFIQRDRYYGSQTSLPREVLERDGEYWPRGHGWWQSRYYTEAGQRREDEALTRNRNSGVPSEHATLLGLGTEFTRADVMRAFRQQAQEHYPDKGGDPAKFRELVVAKDRALMQAA